MSPINEGEVHVATRRLMHQAKQGMETAIRLRLAEIRAQEQAAMAATEVAYRSFHDETYGAVYAELHAQEALARAVHGIEIPTETPVDRWVERYRG